MAHRSDLAGAVSLALEQTPEDEVVNKELQDKARRAKAVTLAMSGMTYEQVGDSLGVSPAAAKKLVKRTIEETRNYAVDELRDLENARLDRAQAAVWPEVVEGDKQAIKLYLSIAERRSRLNGLDAPSKVQMAVSVKAEMEQALTELQQVVLESDEGSSQEEVLAAEEAVAFGASTSPDQPESVTPDENDPPDGADDDVAADEEARAFYDPQTGETTSPQDDTPMTDETEEAGRPYDT